ncbi:MAG: glycosyl hydrolase [Armatimonas sp.]
MHSSELWPEVTRETRPWAYWWWMGSAVDEANLRKELKRYADAGMGGVHIIPIYGAKGYESRYVPYLSDRWLSLLAFTVAEADKLDLGIDITLGTGWCLGGPNVTDTDANSVAEFLPDGTVRIKPSGQKVKRAAPGGEGHMLDPFSPEAHKNYLRRFDDALKRYRGKLPRAIYQDSYEYNAQWTKNLPAEFQKRRGYALPLPPTDLKVRADIRETLSELQVEAQKVWTTWGKKRGFRTRYEAHGSPGNLIDLYALADIPETEMFRDDRSQLVSKLASSAAHLTGKKLTASETGTWLKEHFTETLGDLKKLVDELFLSGINHVFWHGTCYSPDEAAWPGWVFYASTQANPRNPIWHDIPALHAYITRCQSVLQWGAPAEDFLLYWPLRDYWDQPHTDLARKLTVHGREWLEGQPVGPLAQKLFDRGWQFDFVSEKLLKGRLPVRYRAVATPECRRKPPATNRPLLDAAHLSFEALEAALTRAGARRESFADLGIQGTRRMGSNGEAIYFLVNRSEKQIDGFVPLTLPFKDARLLDPWTGAVSIPEIRGQSVYLHLPPAHSMVVRVGRSAFAKTAPPAPVLSGSAGTGEPANPSPNPASGTPVPPNGGIDGGGGGQSPHGLASPLPHRWSCPACALLH